MCCFLAVPVSRRPDTTVSRTLTPSRLLFGAAAVAGRPRLDPLGGEYMSCGSLLPLQSRSPEACRLLLTLHDLAWVGRSRDFFPAMSASGICSQGRACERSVRLGWPQSPSTHVALGLDARGLDPEHVPVARPTVTAYAEPATHDRENRDRYFLWVGALEPRKAPEVLEAAWQTAQSRGLDARLMVVGKGRMSVNRPGVGHRGWVNDAELGALYRGAPALLMPSRLEGALLPPLEAALYGPPSIWSDLPVLRESLGPRGAEWVPPGDADALADALLLLACDHERRDAIAAAATPAARTRADPATAASQMRTLLAEPARA